VWVAYQNSTTPTLYVAPIDNFVNINEGQGLPATLTINFTGGMGGPISYNIVPAAQSLISSATVNYVAKTVTLNLNPQAYLGTGTYSQTVNIIESSPFTSVAPSTTAVTVTVTVNPQTQIQSSPSGTIVYVDNVAVLPPVTYNWAAGEQHTLNAGTSATSIVGEEQVFQSWSTGNAASFTFTVPDAKSVLTADFSLLYDLPLTITPAGGGTVTASPAGSNGYYAPGTLVTLTATPATGFTFSGYSGAIHGTNPVQTIKIGGPFAVTATFVALNSVTLQSNPSGQTITVNSTAYTAPVTLAYLANTQLTISATGQQATGVQSVFQSWSNNQPQTFTYTVQPGSQTLSATFAVSYQIVAQNSGATFGSVALSPAGSNNYYPYGTMITATATPTAIGQFGGWAGLLPRTDVSNPTTFTATAPGAVIGLFGPNPTTTVRMNPVGNFVADGVTYNFLQAFQWAVGSSHTLSVPSPQNDIGAGNQSVFVGWQDLIAQGNYSNTRTIVVQANQNITYTANMGTQVQVGASVSPANSGSVTGGGWYNLNATVTLTATAAGGFAFSNYTGTIGATTPVLTFIAGGPGAEVANFTAASPTLAVTAGTVDGTDPNVATLNLVISNTGAGTAGNMIVASLTATVVDGTGTVGATVPITLGSLTGGQTQTFPIAINWPTSATKVKFKMELNADGGAYTIPVKLEVKR
jgi:List-Bact-rpt repeat protein